MRRAALAAALVAAAVALAACGGDDDGETVAPSTKPAQSDGATVVDMTDALQFEPKSVTVKIGQKLEWVNAGAIAHTVTTAPDAVADPGNVETPEGAETFDSGLIGEGERFERTFDQPGTYRYVCIPHEGTAMVGTVVVEN